jgi:phosphoribosylformylglycinamidine synthase
VAVGADPTRIALLDNFCWGDCERPETLGSLVRAAQACHDLSLAYEAPFISGKDSLNNEFSFVGDAGDKQTISIPSTLLISAMGQMPDASRAVTMDLKQAGNLVYMVGATRNELGGSHFALVHSLSGGAVPKVHAHDAKATYVGLHRAMLDGCVQACHDVSEGGLAVALAEMALAGDLGVDIDLALVPTDDPALAPTVRLFSESNSRLVCEVSPAQAEAFERHFSANSCARIGYVSETGRCVLRAGESILIDLPNNETRRAWQSPFAW